MPTSLPPAVTTFLSTASLDDKRHLLSILTNDIAKATMNLAASSVPNPPAKPELITDFVEHIPDFGIDEQLSSGIQDELTALNLRSRSSKGKPAKVKTQWLSPSNEPYFYGNVINNPKPIGDFPFICQLMEKVNSHPSTTGDMTAALVGCMSTPKSQLSLHADDEKLISQDSSICTVSFGLLRTLEFVWKNKKPIKRGCYIPSDYSVPATNLSMNVMKPGCQERIKHRVPPGTAPGVRYSISFRRISPPITTEDSTESDTNGDTDNDTPDSPIPKPPPKKKVILVAGDSFHERLDADKLGKGKQTVVKVSKGGRKINDVHKAIKEYVEDNPMVEVKTLFLSIGTNDIRHCKNGIGHLKSPLCEF